METQIFFQQTFGLGESTFSELQYNNLFEILTIMINKEQTSKF